MGATNENLREIIQNCPNLEKLRWKAEHNEWVEAAPPTIFPDVHCEKLRDLRIDICTDDTFRSLIDRCPNLTDLSTRVMDSIPIQTWDQFFVTHPHLKLLYLDGTQEDIDWTQIPNFWRLSSLTHLVLLNHPLINGDGCLAAIAASFSKLRHLDIYFLDAPTEGVKAMCLLEELRSFRMRYFHEENIDEGIHRMALNCKNLVSIEIIRYTATRATFIDLIRCCPKLKVMKINSVHDVDNPQAASALLKSLSGQLQPRRIQINLTIAYFGLPSMGIEDVEDQADNEDQADDEVLGVFTNKDSITTFKAWKSKQVKVALKALEEEGVIIELNAYAPLMSSLGYR